MRRRTFIAAAVAALCRPTIPAQASAAAAIEPAAGGYLLPAHLSRALIESRRYGSVNGLVWQRVLPWTTVARGMHCMDYTGDPEHFAEDASLALGHPVTLLELHHPVAPTLQPETSNPP